MKTYFVSALAIAVVAASMANIAQSAPVDHSSHGTPGMNPGEMQAMRDAMQKKLSAAKSDEERQAIMEEQQKQMMEKRAHMMSPEGGSHGMSGMPGNMAERQQMMQKRMGMGMGMMPM